MSRIDYEVDDNGPVGETPTQIDLLKTELAHARQMTAQAIADTALARHVLKLALDEHDAQVAELRGIIECQFAAIAYLKSRKTAAADPVREVDAAAWIMPAGLPRGVR